MHAVATRLNDSGWRNALRRVPNDALLYLPGLQGSGSAITDFSGAARHGTITDATWKRLPSGLYVLNFNGTSAYVSCTIANTDLSGQNYTMMIWFKNTGGAGTRRTLYETAANYTISAEIHSGNELRLYVNLDGAAGNLYTTPLSPVINTLYHLAVTWVGATKTLSYYINGAFQASNVAGDGNLKTFTAFHVGTYRTANDRWFLGYEALPVLIDAVLSASQIYNIYQIQQPFVTI